MDSGLEINARKLTKCELLSTDNLRVRKIASSKRVRIMQISQTFGKNLLVQSHQIASEKNSSDKTLSPGTLTITYFLNIKIHGMNLLELICFLLLTRCTLFAVLLNRENIYFRLNCIITVFHIQIQ